MVYIQKCWSDINKCGHTTKVNLLDPYEVRISLVWNNLNLALRILGHRVSKNCRHRIHFGASVFTSVHCFSACLALSTTVRFYLIFSLPLFLVPCWFQYSAVLAISRTSRLLPYSMADSIHFRSFVSCTHILFINNLLKFLAVCV